MTADNPAQEANNTLGDRLSKRYFMVTLAIFVAVGIPAYFYLTQAVERQFVGNYSDFSINTAAQIFGRHLETIEGGAYTEPLVDERLDAFLVEVRDQIESRELVKIKLWRPDGMLLYSTSGLGVGNIRELDHHLIDALGEGAFSEVEVDVPEVEGEDSSGKVLEIYLPMYDSEGGVANIFELYYGLNPLNSAVASMRITLITFLVVLFAAVAGVAQLGARLLIVRNRKLASLTQALARLAETDGLTGIANHRCFQEQLEREIAASTRYGRPFSVIMVDLDFFKRVNDSYGHQTGDVVLRETAVAMTRVVRDVDLVARYGGEEFAILMPETTETEAVQAAYRLRKAIRDIAVAIDNERISITASFGVAEFPTAALDAQSLVSAADSALYFSKNNGRDRVCAFSTFTQGSIDQQDLGNLFHRLRHASVFTIQALAAAVNGDAGGSGDVSIPIRLAELAGSALELSNGECEALTLAASVYDVGKLTIAGGALEKAESLSPEELAAIREHPETSEKIISAVADLERILKVVRHHHEHFDGGGYPEGLIGDQIPYLSRVLHIIDAYSAMVADCPDSDAMTPQRAVLELRKNAGAQFDPAIVMRFASAVLGDSDEQAFVA